MMLGKENNLSCYLLNINHQITLSNEETKEFLHILVPLLINRGYNPLQQMIGGNLG